MRVALLGLGCNLFLGGLQSLGGFQPWKNRMEDVGSYAPLCRGFVHSLYII